MTPNVNDPRLVAVELWAGPLDGESVEAIPGVDVTCYLNEHSQRVEWYPYVPTYGTTDHWRYLGFYCWRGESRRLTWVAL